MSSFVLKKYLDQEFFNKVLKLYIVRKSNKQKKNKKKNDALSFLMVISEL